MLLLFAVMPCFAQVKWSSDSTAANDLEWSNYSTTYIGDLKNSVPMIVTAIPYNGKFSNADDINTPLDFSFTGSLYRFRSDVSKKGRKLYTYDSLEVYFLTPGIYKKNASDYEYRVVLNAKKEIVPWSAINKFSDIQLNVFEKGFGYLGGFKTTWGNFITVEIRNKKNEAIASTATVYWKEIKPQVKSVFSSKNLNDFFVLLQRPWDRNLSQLTMPSKLTFPSTETNLIFYLSADIYKKEAIEYELVKDGKVYRNWKPNDYDNNFIWLKELPPGKFTLNIRYSAQRQNVATYDFEITPQWQQTTGFKIIMGSLIAAFIAFIGLLLRYKQQQKKLRIAGAEREKMEFGMRSLRAQLNPHFIFNALSSIQGLINSDNKTASNEYLTAFSSLLRQSLAYNDKEFVPLDVEIQMLDTYIRLEKLRFNFTYTITADENIYAASVEMPALLLQPLVENAIKHGISVLQEKGEIHIQFTKQDKNLLVSVTDNGTGYNVAETSSGYGLKLTGQRIVLLNQSLKPQYIDFLTESKKDKGTKCLLIFKHWL